MEFKKAFVIFMLICVIVFLVFVAQDKGWAAAGVGCVMAFGLSVRPRL